jgi:tape measure domain-containing protein
MSLFSGSESSMSIVVKLKDEASKGFDSLRSKMSDFSDQNQKMVDSSKIFAIGMAGAVTALGGLGYSALKAAGDMEQTRVSFTTMLGSAEKATKLINDLQDFAKKTPFELTGLQTATKQLLAYGFAQEEIIPNLRSLGNIASGVGMDKLPNLIMAFGQVKAATKLTGMELRQFTEAGVPLLDALATQFKKPVSAIQEMVSAGKIGFPEVEKALNSLSGEGGRFFNLMDNQSKTLGGMVSNLKDAWNIFLTNEGAKLIEWAKVLVGILIDLIQNKLPVFINAIDAMTTQFDELEPAIFIVAGAITVTLLPAIYAATAAFIAMMVPMLPLIAIGGAIGLMIYNLNEIVKIFQKDSQLVMGGIKAYWEDFGAAVGRVVDWIMSKIEAVIGAFIRMRDTISKPIAGVFNGITSAIGNVVSSTLGIGREHGGIVPGPVGTPVPILAHGQERVVPASQSDTGGNSVTVIIQNPTVRNNSDIDLIRDQIEKVMRPILLNAKIQHI